MHPTGNSIRLSILDTSSSSCRNGVGVNFFPTWMVLKIMLPTTKNPHRIHVPALIQGAYLVRMSMTKYHLYTWKGDSFWCWYLKCERLLSFLFEGYTCVEKYCCASLPFLKLYLYFPCFLTVFSPSIHFLYAPFSYHQIMLANKFSNNLQICLYFLKNLTRLLTPYCGWFISSAGTLLD